MEKVAKTGGEKCKPAFTKGKKESLTLMARRKKKKKRPVKGGEGKATDLDKRKKMLRLITRSRTEHL